MDSNRTNSAKMYFVAMASFWLIFGLITTFYPATYEFVPN
jgi:hypothetical protein